jgi:hypothetical protein
MEQVSDIENQRISLSEPTRSVNCPLQSKTERRFKIGGGQERLKRVQDVGLDVSACRLVQSIPSEIDTRIVKQQR